ncbi:MAG: FtsX-like permease family protein [Planctomycetota bacterium]|nr:FtsX-like permease family protein [Planctomycetota bacterium]
MSIWRLVAKEIGYRRLNFALAAVAVLVAVGSVVAVLTLLKGHRLRAEQIETVQSDKAGEIGFKLKDDARRITKELGYNLLILPKDQNLAEFYTSGGATKTMPIEFAETLADSRIVIVRHLLPSLHRRIEWQEIGEPIIVIGTRGEVPRSHLDPKKPMIESVPRGTIVVGCVLAEKADLEIGSTVRLLGREFEVTKIHERRGNEDDVTAWINLAEAQELFDQTGRINAILALSCLCADTSLGSLTEQVTGLLPETKVIKLEREAAIRRATRASAGERAGEFLELGEAGRRSLRSERQALATWVVPLVVVGCIVWVGLMALGNVRARRAEIGILRAIGVRGGQVVGIFLGRAVMVGLIGAVVGYAVGFALAAVWDGREAGEGLVASGPAGAAALFGPGLLVGVLLLAPILSAAASLVPALLAAQEDPAMILREE